MSRSFYRGMCWPSAKGKTLIEKLADPAEHRPGTNDEIMQAQYKLSGCCPDCGNEKTKEKWGDRCFSCFVHYKKHKGKE